MEQQYYKFRISPENIKGDLIYVPFTGETDITTYIDPCCSTTAQTINTLTGTTGYYLPMNLVLSGGTNGSSLLECLSINLFFQQTAIDIGFSNSSMVKANIAADLVVTLSSFVPGKFTDVIITNTSGQQRTITHGCTEINSSMGATTFNLAATRTCYLRYFSFNNDLANTYVAATYQ